MLHSSPGALLFVGLSMLVTGGKCWATRLQVLFLGQSLPLCVYVGTEFVLFIELMPYPGIAG
jgi:hypothetical protein